MSVVNIVVKTFVKFTHGVLQLVSIVADGTCKLSTKLGDELVSFDEKMAKKFEAKKELDKKDA